MKKEAFENLIEILQKIEPIHLKEENVDKQKVVDWAISIAQAFMQNDAQYINQEQHTVLAETLRSLGVLTLDEIKALQPAEKKENIETMLQETNALFAINAFAHLLNPESYVYCYEKAFSGGRNAWMAQWISTQTDKNTPPAPQR